jgi:hypothetical protein
MGHAGVWIVYPSKPLPGADNYFYWEKVDFGLKPTIRLNHAVIYRGRTQGRDFATVAIKQLYATHYFHTALDVSVCVTDGTAGRPGFYLLTVKGSHQEGLTGCHGIAATQGRRRQDAGLARTCARRDQADGRTPGLRQDVLRRSAVEEDRVLVVRALD